MQSDGAPWRVGELFDFANGTARWASLVGRSRFPQFLMYSGLSLYLFYITENIRDAAPTADEWWEDVAAPPTSSASAPASCRVDSDDVHDNAIATKVAALFSPSALTSPSRQKRFHNVGLETWLRVREEWKQRTVESLPGRPTPAEHSQLVKGLARSSALRTYELPRRMVLSDLISVYNDIWEGDL